jgi:germination protein M
MESVMQESHLKKRILAAAVAILLALGFAGCGYEETETSTSTATVRYYLYYINENYDRLVSETYDPENLDSDAMIAEFQMQCEKKSERDDSLHPLLSDGLKILSTSVSDGVLTLNMNKAYHDLDTAKELLVRAGLVKTFTQCDGISYIKIEVNGSPLRDRNGEEVGQLSTDSFVENAGRSIHTYQSADMKLYFTDQSGDVLIPEERMVYYSSNEPLEKAVVEELIKGTTADGHYPTLSSETKILSVASQDGVCYVNFNNSFKDAVLNVREDVQIYSIVNSLVDTCHVNKVQFSINGKSDMTFRKDMKLDVQYEKNEDLIQES